jgi:hypothetical protein
LDGFVFAGCGHLPSSARSGQVAEPLPPRPVLP